MTGRITVTDTTPAMAQLIPESEHPKYHTALKKLLAWDGQTPIYNAEYNDIRFYLDRAFEHAMDTHRHGVPLPRDKDQRLRSELPVVRFWFIESSRPPLSTLHKSKLLSKLYAFSPKPEEEPLHTFLVTTLKAWTPVSAKMAAMKAAAIKGRKPSEAQVEREAFLAKPTTQAARQIIDEAIQTITAEWRVQKAAAVATALREIAARYVSERQSTSETPAQFWKRTLVPQEPKREGEEWKTYYFKYELWQKTRAHAAYMAEVTAHCEADSHFPDNEGRRQAQAIVDGFSAKMQDKLGFIANTLASITPLQVHNTADVLESTLRVFLTTSTEPAFDVRSQLVYHVSTRGLHFSRFPTTFHNVRSANGTVTAFVPERDMHALFGTDSKAAQVVEDSTNAEEVEVPEAETPPQQTTAKCGIRR